MLFNSAQLFAGYITYSEKVLCLAPVTVKNRKCFVGNFLKDMPEDIQEITIQIVDAYFAKRSSTVKLSSYNRLRSDIRSFFQYVQRYHKIEMQFDYSMIRQLKMQDEKIITFSREEVRSVIKQMKSRQDKLMTAMLFETGMRIGELVSLCVEDISNTQIQIKGKGGKVRIGFMTESLATEIQAYLINRQIFSGPVFRHLQRQYCNTNSFYKTDTVRQRLKREFGRAGYDMHPHQLRHSYATQLLINGADTRSVQKLLGHSQLNTTMRYLQVTDKFLQDTFVKHFSRSVYA